MHKRSTGYVVALTSGGIARGAMELEYSVLHVGNPLELHAVAIMAELRLMVVDDGWVVCFDKRFWRDNDYHFERRRSEDDISLNFLLVPNSQGYGYEIYRY